MNRVALDRAASSAPVTQHTPSSTSSPTRRRSSTPAKRCPCPRDAGRARHNQHRQRERRDDCWYLLPLWKGFEAKQNERSASGRQAGRTSTTCWCARAFPCWSSQSLDLRRLPSPHHREGDPDPIQDGTDMCKQPGLDPEDLVARRAAVRGGLGWAGLGWAGLGWAPIDS